MEKTREEAELEVSSIFCQKVEVCYQWVENPGCHMVDDIHPIMRKGPPDGKCNPK